MKKSFAILAFALFNVVLIQNCGDDPTGNGRQFLDNDTEDYDRSLDNDGDWFRDQDLNDSDGSLDSDDGTSDFDGPDGDMGSGSIRGRGEDGQALDESRGDAEPGRARESDARSGS